MKNLMTFLTLGTFATLLGVASAPIAYAQSELENSTLTVTEPVEVGAFTLQPGTYLIRVVVRTADRFTIQVTNVERTTVFATVLSTPHPVRDEEIVTSSRYIYYSTPPGQTKALRTWFARDAANGHDIVYPRKRALELAAAAKEPVIAIPDAVVEAEYVSAPLVVVTPEKLEKPYEPVTQVAENLPAKELPRTASHVPLYALLGVLALGGALGLHALANRTA